MLFSLSTKRGKAQFGSSVPNSFSIEGAATRENIVVQGVCCDLHAPRSLAQSAPLDERENVAIAQKILKLRGMGDEQYAKSQKSIDLSGVSEIMAV
jgi:hypothetical protein